jgi:hypothetical protein
MDFLMNDEEISMMGASTFIMVPFESTAAYDCSIFRG